MKSLGENAACCLVPLVIILSGAVVVSSQDCSTQTYNTCWKPFSEADPSNAIVPWYSKAVVTEICRRFQAFTECMQRVLPFCSDPKRLIYEGLIAGYNYMCNSGFDDYLIYQQQCFSNGAVQTEAYTCSSVYNRELLILANNTGVDKEFKRDRLCQYSDNYMSCIENALKSYCSVGAATWQKNFDSKQLCPLLTGSQCSGWTTRCSTSQSSSTPQTTNNGSVMTQWAMTLLVCMIVFLLALIVAAVLFAVFFRLRRRRRRLPPAAPAATSVNIQLAQADLYATPRFELPPPYPGPFVCHGLVANASSPMSSSLDDIAPSALPPDCAATILDRAITDVDYACFGNEVKVKGGEGHFVPDDVEMNAKLDEAIPPPFYPHTASTSMSGHDRRRHVHSHENSGFIPLDNDEELRQRGAAASSQSSSSSSSHQHTHGRHHTHYYQQQQQSDGRRRHQSKSPVSSRDRGHHHGGGDMTSRRSSGSVGLSSSSGASSMTSTSINSTNPLMHQSSGTSVTSHRSCLSTAVAAPSSVCDDHEQTQANDIDYY